MRILFVGPHLFDTRSSDALEPLAFAVLAGLTPPDVELVMSDERLAPVPLDESVDLVAITIETYTARRAYQIADHYRQRGIPVSSEAIIRRSCPTRRAPTRMRLSSAMPRVCGATWCAMRAWAF